MVDSEHLSSPLLAVCNLVLNPQEKCLSLDMVTQFRMLRYVTLRLFVCTTSDLVFYKRMRNLHVTG